MDRDPATAVRQGEVHPPVAAPVRAQQREQRLVLVDRQQLAVAQRPSLRREAEAHDSDLSEERLSHGRAPPSYGGVLIGPGISETPNAEAVPVFVLVSCAVASALTGPVSTSWPMPCAPAW